MLLTVTECTWAVPPESVGITPICEGARPVLASVRVCSFTSLDVSLGQMGALGPEAEPAGTGPSRDRACAPRGGGQAAKKSSSPQFLRSVHLVWKMSFL